MVEDVQLCFVNTYIVYLLVNTSWGDGSLFVGREWAHELAIHSPLVPAGVESAAVFLKGASEAGVASRSLLGVSSLLQFAAEKV